jgi:DNA-binding response OmpR family regulator
VAAVVLVVDVDELELRQIALAFRRSGFDVFEASTAIEGLLEELDKAPDLIVLTEEIPPLEAGGMVKLLRRITSVPMIVVGGGGEPEETHTLDMGGDFYLRRPYKPEVMLARARALLRGLKGAGSNIGGGQQHGAQVLPRTFGIEGRFECSQPLNGRWDQDD